MNALPRPDEKSDVDMAEIVFDDSQVAPFDAHVRLTR
jgi:hypothetical protein